MLRSYFLALCSFLIYNSHAQYNWKLEKQKDGISVYLSAIAGSNFKAVKVECTLTGTYTKLVALLSNVSQFSNWIYNTKRTRLLEKKNPLDFIYYQETHMPWPLSNRDLVIHMQIKTDSLPRFLTIKGINENDLLPEIPGKVRVPLYKSSWKVTMPSSQTVKISYMLEVDPGGNLPSWAANSFADKGPFETFSNLAKQLKQ